MESYRKTLADSVQYATSVGAAFIARQEELMETAARALNFEQAQRHRDALSRSRAAQAMTGRWAHSPEDFRWFVLQRGARRETVRPFFCDGGAITTGDDVHLTQISAAADSWAQLSASSDKAGDISAAYRAECIALVCHHLGKGEKASGLYLNAQNALPADEIAQRVQARFSRASSARSELRSIGD